MSHTKAAQAIAELITFLMYDILRLFGNHFRFCASTKIVWI